MLFLSPEDLNRVWRIVVEGVINNRLGPAAKVAPDEGMSGERLICIYTKDFRDKNDIQRVLNELVSVGVSQSESRSDFCEMRSIADDTMQVVGQKGRSIHYKSDPYTYLNIYRETAAEYGLQASLYSSFKLLAEGHETQPVLTPRTHSSLNRRIQAF